MAARYVNECVRLWQTQGLSFLLDGRPAKSLQLAAQAEAQYVSQQGKTQANQRVQPKAVRQEQVVPPVSQQPASQAEPVAQQPSLASSCPGFYSLSQARKDGNIPDVLYAHLGKQPSPVFSIWTYWEFAQDLTSEAFPERKALWANIYKAIIQPNYWGRDSIVFWPLARFEDNTFHLDLSLFQAGLCYLAPVYIFCFGHKAFSALLPEREYSFGQFLYGNYALVSLSGPEDMLPDNRAVKTSVWQTLQRYQPVGRSS